MSLCTNVRQSVLEKHLAGDGPGPGLYNTRVHPAELESSHLRAPAWRLPTAARESGSKGAFFTLPSPPFFCCSSSTRRASSPARTDRTCRMCAGHFCRTALRSAPMEALGARPLSRER